MSDESPVARAILDLVRTKSLPKEPRHPALVMYSGGLDGFAVLYNLLEHTNISIHAHHVELVNFEGREKAKTEAIARQRAYLDAHCRA